MAKKWDLSIVDISVIGSPEEMFRNSIKIIKALDYTEFKIRNDKWIVVDHHRTGGFRVRRRSYTTKPVTHDEAIVPSAREAVLKVGEYAALR